MALFTLAYSLSVLRIVELCREWVYSDCKRVFLLADMSWTQQQLPAGVINHAKTRRSEESSIDLRQLSGDTGRYGNRRNRKQNTGSFSN